MRTCSLIAFGAEAILLASCGQSVSDTVSFSGDITLESVKSFKQKLDSYRGDNIKWIEITSAGGDSRAGLILGSLIRERDLSVRVRDFCVSACAQSAFLAGRRKYVMNGSLVIFHNTIGMTHGLLEAANSSAGAKLFGPYTILEERFLKKLGIPYDLTSASIAALLPLCFIENKELGTADFNRFGIATANAGFTFSRAAILQVTGNTVEGYWPHTEGEMSTVLKSLPFRSDFRVAWVSEIDTRASAEPKFPVLEICPPSLIGRKST